jgi:hypothetical protein
VGSPLWLGVGSKDSCNTSLHPPHGLWGSSDQPRLCHMVSRQQKQVSTQSQRLGAFQLLLVYLLMASSQSKSHDQSQTQGVEKWTPYLERKARRFHCKGTGMGGTCGHLNPPDTPKACEEHTKECLFHRCHHLVRKQVALVSRGKGTLLRALVLWVIKGES